ncbi:type II secretion system protein, partial [bacterium]|nr:type II secretion system protein [bacterium]
TVTTFFQLFSASLRLEQRGRGFDEVIVVGRQIFTQLLARDLLKDEFPWLGESEKFAWNLHLEAIDVKPDTDVNVDDEGIALRWTSELYCLVFAIQDTQRPGRHLRLISYRQVAPGYFSDDFKEKHFAPEK